jgi:hypothetical protein
MKREEIIFIKVKKIINWKILLFIWNISKYESIVYFNLIFFSIGHKGKFGHEFLEFEFNSDGCLKYANNS